jgi:hypothetical protein
MFATPIDALTFQDVENFCQTRLREGLVLDYKLDFPKHLDKTIASFANTHGGHILIGVGETKTGEPVLPIAGVPLQPGLRERVVATALQGINPPVYPEVRVLEFKSSDATTNDRAVVVVRVHESEDGAHAVDGNTSVYLRVDNISDHFTRKATIEEIGWLTNKRQKSLALKTDLMDTARARSQNVLPAWRTAQQLSTQEPKGTFAVWSVPKFPRTELASPERLLQFSRSQQWRQALVNLEFPLGSALPVADGIRHPESNRRNYWYTEINRYGLVYTRVGFPPSSEKEAINCAYAARLLVGGLCFSLNLYENMLGYFGLVDFGFSVTPTRNTYPYLWQGESYWESRCLDDTITVQFSASVKEIRDSLIQRAKECYQEFFWAFGMRVDGTAAASHFRAFQALPSDYTV